MSSYSELSMRQTLETNPDLIPAIKPPPGAVSDLYNPPSNAPATIGAMVLFFSLATPIVAARIWTRIYVHSSLWWDDWTSILALVGLYGVGSIVLISVGYGNAVDEWNVSKSHAAHFEDLFKDIEVTARISIFFTKLSILLLYIRYFCPPRSRRTNIYWATWAVIIFNLLYCVALVLTVTLQCVGKSVSAGQSCINGYAVLVTASIINVLTDLVMLVIPIVAIWSLQMPRKRRLGLWIVFAVGALAVISSVARLGYQIPEAKTKNRTVLLANVSILALAEHTIGIIVGCMPVLPSLYRHVVGPKTPSQYSSGSSNSRWKAAFSNSPVNRNRNKPRRLNDSDLFHTDNQEFDTLTTQVGSGTTTTVEGGQRLSGAPTIPPSTFHFDRENNALVSQSVQVTSFPKSEQ